MILQSITLHRHEYGPDKGKLAGSISIASQTGTISLKMTDTQAQRVVAICADELVAQAREIAEDMTAEVISATPLIEGA